MRHAHEAFGFYLSQNGQKFRGGNAVYGFFAYDWKNEIFHPAQDVPFGYWRPTASEFFNPFPRNGLKGIFSRVFRPGLRLAFGGAWVYIVHQQLFCRFSAFSGLFQTDGRIWADNKQLVFSQIPEDAVLSILFDGLNRSVKKLQNNRSVIIWRTTVY